MRRASGWSAGTALLLFGAVVPAWAQTRPAGVETDLTKDPSGIPLVHVAKGTPLVLGGARDGWEEATVEGWISQDALRDDKRAGFDLSVSAAGGTSLRDKPGAATALGVARFGALFHRLDSRDGWVHVKRTGWVIISAMSVTVAAAPRPVAPPPPPPASPPAAAPAVTQKAVAPASPPKAPPSIGTIAAGSALALEAAGPTVATIEAPVPGQIVERRDGWTHLRVDAWVRDASLGDAEPPGGITAADLRAAPDKYIGQTVEWTVELLSIQMADELRPEMPEGQPYLLARGPLPESGFVYIVITKADVDSFRRLEPLAKIRIRATIRAGKSRFLPTPVLNFVRRLD